MELKRDMSKVAASGGYTINRTKVELKQRLLRRKEKRRFYQSYQSGIETIIIRYCARCSGYYQSYQSGIETVFTGCGNVAHHNYQSYQSGIETITGRANKVLTMPINRTKVELKHVSTPA